MAIMLPGSANAWYCDRVMPIAAPVLNRILSRMAGYGERPAICWRDTVLSYHDLTARIAECEEQLIRFGVAPGAVCALMGEYSPQCCAAMFALMRRGAIVQPLTAAARPEDTELLTIAGAEYRIEIDSKDRLACKPVQAHSVNPLIRSFRECGRAGLVIFTSGSSGRPKGILHDSERVLAKFAEERYGWRTILFLLIDHFGGLNTLFSVFASGGVAICPEQRSPEVVCRLIERWRAELLPTTPTFLNLLLASGIWHWVDLGYLRLITYGTEPMSERVLARLRTVFPRAKLKQTYGLSEIGVLRSQSQNNKTTWVRLGGDGFETRIVDSVLWVRSASNMVGYLNAPSPIDAEGWMNTGDVVEERDGLVRFRGRLSDIINVGGRKVFPSEIETVLEAAKNVAQATVYALQHPFLGQVPCASIVLERPEDNEAVQERMRRHCLERLAKFKVPMRFVVVESGAHASSRFKTVRPAAANAVTAP
jgi:long-chain acyl-CoA synthetase